jgi:hypothetical protein
MLLLSFFAARRRSDGIFRMERVNFAVKRSLKSPSRALHSLVYVRGRDALIVIPCFTHPREITNSLQSGEAAAASLLP